MLTHVLPPAACYRFQGDLLLQVEQLKGEIQALQSIAAGTDPDETGPKWGTGLHGDLVYKNRYSAAP